MNVEPDEHIIRDLFEYSEHFILRTATKEAIESFYTQSLPNFVSHFSDWKFKREYTTNIVKSFLKLGLVQVINKKKIMMFFFMFY